MKSNILSSVIFLSVFTVSLFSCNKIKELAKINIELSSADIEFTIPKINATGPATLADKNVYLNVDSIIKANNAELGAKYIKSVTLKSCTITMVDGDANNNFSALESCKVDFSSNINGSKVKLAEITNNPDVESYELTFPLGGTVNLKDYFNATTFSYNITGSARKTTSKDINCKATIRYTLEAGL